MKRLLSVVAIFLSIIFISEVKAEVYNGYIYEGETIDNIYYYKHREDTDDIKYEFHNFHKQATVYRRTSDNHFVYCIESWIPLQGATFGDYQELTSKENLNLSEEQISKIKKLAYYGYGYKDLKYDHTDIKWYAITQFMIWQIQAPHIEHYFVNSISGTTPLNIYNDEIEELNKIINNDTKPNLEINKDMFIKDTIIITNTNNLLDQYEITSTDNLEVNLIDNQKISIKAINSGKGRIILAKKYSYYSSDPIYYISENYQDALLVGNLEDENIIYDINIKSGTMKFYFTKYDPYQQKYISYDNLKISLYEKETNELISSTTTNKDGYAEFINLEKGNYYFIDEYDKQIYLPIITSNERTINDNSYTHTSYLTHNTQMLKVSFQKFKESIEIKNNRINYIYERAPNVTYGLFNENDQLINEAKTNSNGIITFYERIPYGKYYLKELQTEEKYELDNNKYYFEFYKEDDSDVKQLNQLFTFVNKLKKGELIINKVDESKRPLGNVEFSILDENNNIVYETKTDINGKINIELPYGKYYIKETKTLDNYILNEELIPIEINNNEKIIEIINKSSEKNEIRLPDTNNDSIEVEVPSTSKYSSFGAINIIIILIFVLIKEYA